MYIILPVVWPAMSPFLSLSQHPSCLSSEKIRDWRIAGKVMRVSFCNSWWHPDFLYVEFPLTQWYLKAQGLRVDPSYSFCRASCELQVKLFLWIARHLKFYLDDSFYPWGAGAWSHESRQNLGVRFPFFQDSHEKPAITQNFWGKIYWNLWTSAILSAF